MLPGFPSHPGGWENEDSSQLDSSMAFVGEKRGNATRQREREGTAHHAAKAKAVPLLSVCCIGARCLENFGKPGVQVKTGQLCVSPELGARIPASTAPV